MSEPLTSPEAPEPSSSPSQPTESAPTPTDEPAPWPSIDNRPQVVANGLAQRGGQIGTGGKPAVALRFDHHLDDFGAKVLPLLEKYRLPWGQMINAERVNNPNFDDNWTWQQLAHTAHTTGGEVWNHAMTHKSFSTVEEADYEVTEGLHTLRSNLPTLYIDGWAAPGQSELMGMEGSNTLEKLYDTYPGRLVLNQHAFIRGYFPDKYRPLNARNLIGTPHITIDKLKNGQVQRYVRRVLGTDNGVTLMLHPNYLDRTGYLTTNELDDALSYIAYLRDTDQIEVLSNTGILMADSGLDEHHGNHLKVPGESALRGELIVEVDSGEVLGVPHEAEVWLTGRDVASIKVTVESPTHPIEAEHSATLGEEPQRVSVVVTPPLDATKITVSVEGQGNYSGLSYQPI